MYKSVCVAVLLLAAFAFTSRSQTVKAAGSGLTSPVIVASVKLPNLVAGIPQTTIYTPAEDGLYRVTAYATTTQASSKSPDWTYSLGWTDDAGPQLESFVLQQEGVGKGPLINDYNFYGGAVRTFEAKAGTPIEYSVRQYYSNDGEISLYFVVEQLE